MIQLLGVRTWFDEKEGKEKKKDAFFGKNWRAPSVADLLQNIDAYLEAIPEVERFNLFFTQFQGTSKKREFKEQWVVWFDIDGIDVTKVGVSDSARLIAEMKNQPIPPSPYIRVFCETLGLKPEDVGAIFSGHGLHLLVQLKEPFTEAKYFSDKRPHYNAVCDKLNLKLAEAGLPGHMDRGVFNQGVIGVRLPGTENRKPDKPHVQVKLIQKHMTPVDFDLVKLSGLPVVLDTEQVKNPRTFRVDTQAVLSGCDFLKAWKTEPETMREPNWYAMLSIIGRCDNGSALAQEYSRGFDKYTPEATERKLDQALEASAPRTCKNINKDWGKCKDCPHFEKINSPISLKGEGFIETQDTGFHSVHYDKAGNAKTGKPCYEDLRKFFDQRYKYRIMGASGICYTWSGTHYEVMEDPYLKEYAQTHFEPKAHKGTREEFKDLICSLNLTHPNWFQETTEKKINFKNGVLDLRTGDLGPHSRDFGFRYCLPYDYDSEAKAPRFEKFLQDVMCNDRQLQDVLLEFAGYSFSGDFPKQGKTLVLTGIGENGKSTFIDVLKQLAGGCNYSSLDWKSLRNETFREALDGKLFNLAEESPADAMKDSAFFKNIVTGGEMLINRKYKQPYSIANKTKLIWACNTLPESKDTTDGFFRRFLIIPFDAKFSDELGNDDKDLREKLYKELPGIFNLVYKGYTRLLQQGRFTSAEMSKRALEKYKSEVDHASTWIKENVTWTYLNGGERFAVISEMYQNYRTEMFSKGEDPVTAVHFGKKLSRIIPEYDQRLKAKKMSGKTGRVLLDCTYQSTSEM